MTLLQAAAGERVRVIGLGREVRLLECLGFFEGSELAVLTTTRGGMIVRLRGVTYALGRRTAAEISVERGQWGVR